MIKNTRVRVKVVPFTFLGTVTTGSKITKIHTRKGSTLCLLGPVATINFGNQVIADNRIEKI